MSLKTKASKRKLRRWTFEARFTKPAENGKVSEYRLPLQTMDIGPEKDARRTALALQAELAKTPTFAGAIEMSVVCVEHETVSVEVLQQMQGYKAFNDILQVALEKAATDVARRVSPDIVQLADGQTVGQEHIGKLKSFYYEAARASMEDEHKKRSAPSAEVVVETNDKPVDLEKLQALAQGISPDPEPVVAEG